MKRNRLPNSASEYHLNDFTEKNYSSLLKIATDHYSFIPFSDYRQTGSTVLWRHDVDYSVKRALAMAKIEAQHKIQTTYFLHLHSEYYNLMAPETRDIMLAIKELGHDLGLHFDPSFYGTSVESIDKLEILLKREKNNLQDLLETEINSFSIHNPETVQHINTNTDEIAGMVNAYGEFITQNYKYCSDSNGYWRFERLEDILKSTDHEKLHVLTHPVWWGTKVMTPRERISQSINNGAMGQHKKYDQLLHACNRQNVGNEGEINILMPSGGGQTFTGILNYLRASRTASFRIIVCDRAETSPAQEIADKYYQSPDIKDKDYLTFIRQICKDEQIDVILPSINSDVLFFSNHLGEFKEIGAHPCVSSPEACRLAADKTSCYEHLDKNGFNVPQYIEVRSAKEFSAACRSLGYPNKKICMKPARYPDGSGKGFRIIDPAMNIDRRMFWELPSELYYVSHDAVEAAMKKESDFPPMLIMEYLPGKEYSVYCLCENGHCHYVVPNLRKKLFLTNSLEAEIEQNEEIEELAKQICELFKFDYNINIQIKYSADNLPTIVEINPRLAGTILLPVAAGADLPLWSIMMAMGKDFPKTQKILNGTRITRYRKEIFYYNNESFTL